MSTLTPKPVQTLMDPVDLEALIEDVSGTPATFTTVPFDILDPCSVCAENDPCGPGESLLYIQYRSNLRVYREPVCGRLCAGQRINELAGNSRPAFLRPDFIHVYVLEQRRPVNHWSAARMSMLDMEGPTRINPAWSVSHVVDQSDDTDEVQIKVDATLDTREPADVEQLVRMRLALDAALARCHATPTIPRSA